MLPLVLSSALFAGVLEHACASFFDAVLDIHELLHHSIGHLASLCISHAAAFLQQDQVAALLMHSAEAWLAEQLLLLW